MALIPLSVEERRGGYRLRNVEEVITALDKTEIGEPVEFALNAPYEAVNRALWDKISNIDIKTYWGTKVGGLGLLGGIFLSACVGSNYLLLALGPPLLAEYYRGKSKEKIESLEELSQRLYSVYGR
ncbi:MAG: hypothetical protein KAT28_03815 [Candidatus Aenigmarchaeota archaeon]|nr:hypothetical protein [Candidatus Aenigmarchaeota archaeon]